MVTEKVKNLALRREIQVLAVFGVVVVVSYYFYMKNQSQKKIEKKEQEISTN